MDFYLKITVTGFILMLVSFMGMRFADEVLEDGIVQDIVGNISAAGTLISFAAMVISGILALWTT